MSECYEHPHLDEWHEFHKTLQAGDYVVWDRQETTESHVRETIVTFDDISAVREYNRNSGPVKWQDGPLSNIYAYRKNVSKKPE